MLVVRLVPMYKNPSYLDDNDDDNDNDNDDDNDDDDDDDTFFSC